jgi:Uncharacterized proteins, LmbE homologs
MNEALQIIVIAAHPDEAEIYAGGTAALYAELGHNVKFVSLTNGDCGHYSMKGKELIERRTQEAYEAARRLGVKEYTILDIPDGQLSSTHEVRSEVIRLVRNWKADVVLTFHPDGPGHVDNRGAGKIVRDCADFIAMVPNAVPDAPHLLKSPLFLLMPDYAKRSAYRPDIVVSVDSAIEKKLLGCDAHASQFYEFAPWQRGFLDSVPSGWEDRRQYILDNWSAFLDVSEEMKSPLETFYGKEAASRVRYAEPFEVADYGRTPDEEEKRKLFPMLYLQYRQ